MSRRHVAIVAPRDGKMLWVRVLSCSSSCKKPWKLWFLCDFGKIWPHSCGFGELAILCPLLAANHHDRTCHPPRTIDTVRSHLGWFWCFFLENFSFIYWIRWILNFIGLLFWIVGFLFFFLSFVNFLFLRFYFFNFYDSLLKF